MCRVEAGQGEGRPGVPPVPAADQDLAVRLGQDVVRPAVRPRAELERLPPVPVAVVRVPLDERRTVHVEYFGAYSSGKAESFRKHYLSAGASYLVTPDLEVGVRGGWGLNDTAARGFVNAGFSWRY
jgi:hypothetical protein